MLIGGLGSDTISGGNGDFRFAGMNATAFEVSLQIDGRLAASCAECAGTREIDRCLVATWQMSVDGMEQWMREHIHKATVTGVSQVGNTLTLNSDGTFATGASRVNVQLVSRKRTSQPLPRRERDERHDQRDQGWAHDHYPPPGKRNAALLARIFMRQQLLYADHADRKYGQRGVDIHKDDTIALTSPFQDEWVLVEERAKRRQSAMTQATGG